MNHWIKDLNKCLGHLRLRFPAYEVGWQRTDGAGVFPSNYLGIHVLFIDDYDDEGSLMLYPAYTFHYYISPSIHMDLYLPQHAAVHTLRCMLNNEGHAVKAWTLNPSAVHF